MGEWNVKGLPHKGWQWTGSEDMEEAIHTCELCGKEQIRYVHIMIHEAVRDPVRVGCVCAEKMTEEYANGFFKERENILKNIAARRKNFPSRAQWHHNPKKNSHFIVIDGYTVTIFPHPQNPSRWKYVFSLLKNKPQFSKISYSTVLEAQFACFDDFIKQTLIDN